MEVAISDIVVGKRNRVMGDVSALIGSIADVGLLNPITVTQDNRLVAGRHRLAACQQLGWQKIPVVVVKLDDLDRELAEIDENLIRNQLTELEESLQIARRKEIYEIKHPETKHGANGGWHGNKGGRNGPLETDIVSVSSFTEDTAKKTGKTSRTIRRKAVIGKNLKNKAAKIAGTVIEDSQKDLLALSRMDDAEKDAVLERIASGDAENVKQAQRQVKQAIAKQEAASKPRSELWTITDVQDVIQCHALITDPPYGILKETWEPAQLEEFTREWASRWNNCGADFCLIFWSQAHLWSGRQWFDSSLGNYTFQQLLIWNYPNNKKHQNQLGFKQTWEPIFFYRRQGSKKKILVDSASGEWGKEQNDFDCLSAAVPQSNFNGADCKEHPAQKPTAVMRWLVGASTRAGDLICDPFTGSGTTGIAAAQLGRRFHGIETDSKYRKLAEDRIRTYGV